jgi:hypothetical protein
MKRYKKNFYVQKLYFKAQKTQRSHRKVLNHFGLNKSYPQLFIIVSTNSKLKLSISYLFLANSFIIH